MSKYVPFQIPLSISLRDDARFENFHAVGNELACATLRASAVGDGEQLLYIWGHPGVGCSHLLQAACHEAEPARRSAAYLPLDELKFMGPGVLEGMEHLDLVCLDNLEAVSGEKKWEEALFHFFNRIRAEGNHLVVAASAPPKQAGIKLPDLLSRLSWGIIFQIHSLDDAEKAAVIKKRAQARGIQLSDEVVRFLIHHASRNMGDLFGLLEALDRASLSAQRKVTIPLVKEVTGL